jgi:transposase InsO family protein
MGPGPPARPFATYSIGTAWSASLEHTVAWATPASPSTAMSAPHLVWCTDFKGQFKTRDSLYCYPLTVTDGYSRYLLGCKA